MNILGKCGIIVLIYINLPLLPLTFLNLSLSFYLSYLPTFRQRKADAIRQITTVNDVSSIFVKRTLSSIDIVFIPDVALSKNISLSPILLASYFSFQTLCVVATIRRGTLLRLIYPGLCAPGWRSLPGIKKNL